MKLKTTILFFLLLSTETVSFGGWFDCPGCNPFPVDDFTQTQDVDIKMAVVEQLNSSEAQEFLSSFNSPFERTSLYKQLYACPDTPLCEYMLNVQMMTPYGTESCCQLCSCVFPTCLLDNSCCLDIMYRNANLTYQASQNATDSMKSCVQSYLSAASRVQYDIVMYASCPPYTAEQLRSNCTREYSSDMKTFKDITPVYDIETSELYRNAYCAYCHDLLDSNIEQVKMRLFCNKTIRYYSEQDFITSVMTTKICNISFEVLDISTEVCIITVSECNVTGQWLIYDMELEKACSMYSTIIRINNKAYQNIFCALCNGEELKTEQYCEWLGMFEPSKSFSFSGLLKLGTTINEQHEINSRKRNCPPGYIFDSVHDTCRELFCSPFQMFKDGKCSDLYTRLDNILYIIDFKIIPLKTITVREAYAIASKVKQRVNELLFGLDPICVGQMVYKIDASFDTMRTGDVINSALKYIILRIDANLFSLNSSNQLLKTAMSMDQLDIKIEETKEINKTLRFDLQIIHGRSELFHSLSNKSFYLDAEKMFGQTATQIPLDTVIRHFAIEGNTPGLEFPHLQMSDWRSSNIQNLEMNVLQLKQCPQVKLSKHKLKWIYNDDGIILGNYKIEASELYFEDDDNILVCHETYKKYLSYESHHTNQHGMSLETIVSIISTSLSIVCLISTVLVFCLLPKLRQTLPGKNNLCLACVLLCAQSMYLLTGIGVLHVDTTACIVFGLMLHFVWLLSMFWMNACTYHMFFVLTKLTITTHSSLWRRFSCYHFYATIMSTIPVAVNIAVSLYTTGSYGYGDVTCYISSQTMVTYTFGIPTLFIVVTNLIMFSFVTIRIKITSMVRKNVTNERRNLVIFAKLSTLTGITWLFGFVYSWTDHVVFSYIFIFLNASQGVFFMLAFICNRRVVNMFKSKYHSHGVRT